MNKTLIKLAGFGHFVKAVESDKCPTCEKPIDTTTFRNDISRQEFKISGMCQRCQDEVFGKD